jgi:hypothetical protein
VASDLLTPIDIYCERTSADLWAEPVNALSNAAFIIAAVIGWRAARRAGRLDGPTILLIALTASIGVGSFLFHTFATRWAALADVVPIGLFIVTYLTIVMRRFFGLGWPVAVLLGASFVPAGMVLTSAIPPALTSAVSGSTRYLPALLFLAVCGGLLAARSQSAGRALLFGAGLFVVSLTFRSVDAPLCQAVPIGTHFVWHVFNGALLAWLLVTMVRYGREWTPHR